MLCSNCKRLIKQLDSTCPYCGVYLGNASLINGEELFNDDKLNANVKNRKIIKANLIFSEKKVYYIYEDIEVLTVGRKDYRTFPDIDLGPLDQFGGISRRHGEFFLSNGLLCYRDYSKNGTFLNGTILKKGISVQIKDGDILRFGIIDGVVKFID